MKLPNWVNTTSVRVLVLAKYRGNLVSWQPIYYSNGNFVIQATFKVNGKKVSRFISKKDIFSGAIAIRSTRSSTVDLKAVHTASHYVLDDNGQPKYICSISDCTCPDAETNELDKILGYKICKHTIASAKKQGINSLHQLTSAIAGDYNIPQLPLPSRMQ